MGIPKDFLDAARVDGCTEYGIFFKIMIPLMKPSFAAMGIYQGMQPQQLGEMGLAMNVGKCDRIN